MFDKTIGKSINSAIKYWDRKGYLTEEKKVFALWRAQDCSLETDKEVWQYVFKSVAAVWCGVYSSSCDKEGLIVFPAVFWQLWLN